MIGVYILIRCLLVFITVIDFAMLLRAILSWFTMGEQNKLGAFLFVLTEPLILPIRNLCARFGWFRGMPLDMPFLITVVLLSIVSAFLRAYSGL